MEEGRREEGGWEWKKGGDRRGRGQRELSGMN